MAAPIVRHVVQLRWAFGRHVVPPCACSLQLQPVRHKGQQRARPPPTAKDKDKWVSTRGRLSKAAKIIPSNWTETFLSRQPEDNVWIRTYYPKPKYEFVDVVRMHQERAMPEMLDNLNGLLYAHVQLDMRTKKKTKFMQNAKSTVVLPHKFDDGTSNRVLAFVKTPEEKQVADELGAVFSGGIDLIKEIEKGEVTTEDYDHVVCNIGLIPEVTNIRKYLKDHFPSKVKGNLGTDIEAMMRHFTDGRTFESVKEDEATAHVTLTLGRVFANQFKRPFSEAPFIQKAVITAPPSTEKFQLVDEEVLPLARRQVEVEEEETGEEDEEDEAEAAIVAK